MVPAGTPCHRTEAPLSWGMSGPAGAPGPAGPPGSSGPGNIQYVEGHVPHPFLELADDSTFVDKRWARDPVRALAAAEVHWFSTTFARAIARVSQ